MNIKPTIEIGNRGVRLFNRIDINEYKGDLLDASTITELPFRGMDKIDDNMIPIAQRLQDWEIIKGGKISLPGFKEVFERVGTEEFELKETAGMSRDKKGNFIKKNQDLAKSVLLSRLLPLDLLSKKYEDEDFDLVLRALRCLKQSDAKGFNSNKIILDRLPFDDVQKGTFDASKIVVMDLSGLNLQGLILKDINLANANLKKTILAWAYLEEANFENANLTGADLSWADCRYVNFKEATLLETDFTWTKTGI